MARVQEELRTPYGVQVDEDDEEGSDVESLAPSVATLDSITQNARLYSFLILEYKRGPRLYIFSTPVARHFCDTQRSPTIGLGPCSRRTLVR